MLQSYIELIQKGIEKLTSLGPQNNTFIDYITAVGYEFLILGLGLLYLVGIVLLIAFPFVTVRFLMWRIKEYYKKKYPKADMYYRYGYCCTDGPKLYFKRLLNAKKYKAHALNDIYKVFKLLEEQKELLFTTQTVVKDLVYKTYNEWSKNNNIDIDKLCKDLYNELATLGVMQEFSEVEKLYYKIDNKISFFKIFVSVIIGLVWVLFLIPFILMMI